MKRSKLTRRIVTLILALVTGVMLLSVLSACGNQKTTAAAPDWNSGDTVITYYVRLLQSDAAAREKFTAAYRGYDMTAEGFDDEAVGLFVTKDTDVEAAKAAVLSVAGLTDMHKEKINEWNAALTADQVGEIVAGLKTEIDLTAKTSPLVWIGKFLSILTKITGGNYVGGLFVFAIIIEILLLPFGIRQQKNSIRQAGMRPKEMAIRKKYAGRNDQVSQKKMQEELQRMYQEEGVNPMSGCLPMLVQLPIVIILYQIVIDPLRYVLGKAVGLTSALSTYVTTARAAGGLGLSVSSSRGTIELLSLLTEENRAGLSQFAYFSNAQACADELSNVSVPNFNLFGANMGVIPSITKPSWLWLVPILTFAVYFVSMKVNRKLSFQPVAMDQQTGCSNNIMDITMPAMSVYITFIVPAAVGIYWIFKSLLGMLKQFVLFKTMPLPTFTEEDYKAAERELKGKSKPEKRAAGERVTADGKVVRSLHHIDDDDDLPPRTVGSDDEEEDRPRPQPQAKKSKSGYAAPMKDDRKTDVGEDAEDAGNDNENEEG